MRCSWQRVLTHISLRTIFCAFSRRSFFLRQFFVKCGSCGDPVVGDERGGSVTVNDVEYHGECVSCAVCQCALNVTEQPVYARPRGEDENATQMLLCEEHKDFVPEEHYCKSSVHARHRNKPLSCRTERDPF